MSKSFLVVAVFLVLPIPLFASAHVQVARFIAVTKQANYLLIVCSLAFVAGTIGLPWPQAPLWASIVLVTPLYQFLVVRYLYRRFVRRFDRDPVDVALSLERGLKNDRSLAMSYAVFGLSVPLAVLFWSIWGLGLAP